eukprot:3390041-Prymnesium_polylepis.1
MPSRCRNAAIWARRLSARGMLSSTEGTVATTLDMVAPLHTIVSNTPLADACVCWSAVCALGRVALLALAHGRPRGWLDQRQLPSMRRCTVLAAVCGVASPSLELRRAIECCRRLSPRTGWQLVQLRGQISL